MKIIPSSTRRHCLARVSVFLVMAALIVGMVGCGPTQYNLTIFVTVGGELTTPHMGIFTYGAGTVVDLVVGAHCGYQFVNWTGNVSTIANVNAAATNITMNGDYSITANFAPETGTSKNLEIRTWYDLYAVRDNLAGSHTLMNDLDSTTPGYEALASPTATGGNGWQPIETECHSFTGSFDGQGYEIRDLSINRPDEGDVGLFGTVSEGGVIKNLGVVNATVIGYDVYGVGGLVGYNAGTVSNSYSTGDVTGYGGVGGLVGYNAGTVSNSYSTGSVTGNWSVGGLVGFNEGTVSNSYATGSVAGNKYVGGLVGYQYYYGTVSNSYATGNVTGTSYVGGLMGYSEGGIVSNSFWDIQTSGQSTSDGGTDENTTEMQDIATFSGAGWNIIAVGGLGERNPSYIWNIVNGVTYPFLSWQP